MNEDGILCTREEDLLPIKDYDDWRIPFIGRRVKENFWEKFQKQGDLLKDDLCAYLCLEETQEDLNWADSEYRLHSLKVYFEKEKMGDGFVIKSLLGCHYTCFSTTSNWQDHHERRETYYVSPEDFEKYIEILDPCTEEIYYETWHDFIFGLFLLVKSTDKRFANCPIEKNSHGYFIFAGIHSAQMAKLLSYSRLFLEPFFAPHYARLIPLFSGLICEYNIDAISALLGRIDLNSFVGGTKDLTACKNRAFSRMMDRLPIACDLFEMAPKSMAAYLEMRYGERTSREKHDLNEKAIIGKLTKEHFANQIDARNIPLESLFYFTLDLNLKGFVTPDGSAFLISSRWPFLPDSAKPIGKTLSDGTVIDSAGRALCQIKNNEIKPGHYEGSLYNQPFHFCCRIDDDGMIILDEKVIGFAYAEKKNSPRRNGQIELETLSLDTSSRRTSQASDARLSGLALFGYLPTGFLLWKSAEFTKKKLASQQPGCRDEMHI